MDFSQRTAAPESLLPDTSYAVREVYARQQTAPPVFATHCISIDFVLNGRKVPSWILRMVKKMKI